MTSKKFIITLITLFTLFVGFIIFVISFRNILKDYGAVISSISTFMYLIVNSLVVFINLSNMDYNQKPVVIISFVKENNTQGGFTFRNIGNSAAIVKSIAIDQHWLEEFFELNPQIDEDEKKFLRELKQTHIIIPPSSQITIRPLIEPQKILDSQNNNAVSVSLRYENINKRKFHKTVVFDFKQYNEMIRYSPTK